MACLGRSTKDRIIQGVAAMVMSNSQSQLRGIQFITFDSEWKHSVATDEAINRGKAYFNTAPYIKTTSSPYGFGKKKPRDIREAEYERRVMWQKYWWTLGADQRGMGHVKMANAWNDDKDREASHVNVYSPYNSDYKMHRVIPPEEFNVNSSNELQIWQNMSAADRAKEIEAGNTRLRDFHHWQERLHVAHVKPYA
eukprot:gene21556-8276_t